METKEIKVVMLPTGDITPIVKHSTGLDKVYHTVESAKKAVLDIGGQSQHLYFLSDEETQVGDWFLRLENTINKGGELELILEDEIAQRLVSNKNPELFLDDGYINGVCYDSGYAEKCVGNYLLKDCKKIIATTDISLNLPHPSTDFIKAYVKAGEIDKVLVEYYRDEETMQENIDSKGKVSSWRLKVNSYNEITIHPIKNSWNREEVEKLLEKALKQEDYNTEFGQKRDIKIWINKNLK